MATVMESNDTFTAFWNDVLVAKFERLPQHHARRAFVSQRGAVGEA